MSRARRTSPVPRYLGPSAEGGPLELLGLTVSECTPTRIEAALQTQLDRVDAHPESATPEADDVRLALHTAAAQLLDPSVRRLLVGEAVAPRTEPPQARAAVPELVEESAPVLDESAPEPDVPAVPAMRQPALAPEPASAAPQPQHPWTDSYTRTADDDPNRTVRRVLLGVGIFAGLCVLIGGVGLMIMITSGSGGGGSPASAVDPNLAQGGAASVPAPGSAASPAAPVPPPAPAADATAAAPPAPAAPPKPGETEFTDPILVLRHLRAATATAKTDSVAGLRAFQMALPALAEWWGRFDTAQRRAADDAVVEFLFATAGDAQVSAAAVDELARRATLPESGVIEPVHVWPAAWAAGVLTRLSNERELPRALGANVNAAINAALGEGRTSGALSFEAGANAILRRMPARLVPAVRPVDPDTGLPPERSASAAAIKKWMDAVLVVNHDPMDAERVLADGLEQVLIAGPEPDGNLGAYEAIELLVTKIKWREGGAARDRLLEWFLDPAVTEADLRSLTGVLANKSGAEGVDATMVLSVGASPDDRAKLRAQYATAWGIVQSAARDTAQRHWRASAEGAAGTQPSREAFATLIGVVGASRYNLAARRLWLGDALGATKIVDDTPGLLAALPNTASATSSGAAPAVAPGSPPPPGQPGPTRGPAKLPRTPTTQPANAKTPEPFSLSGVDGHWAEAYLKAERNIPVRMDRLSALGQMPNPIGRIDAAVLAEAACFASPAQVRMAAQHAAYRFVDDAAMVEAMLQMLPIAPRIASVAQVYEQVARDRLPKVGDPDWELHTRRALVERLLSMLAAQGEQAGIELATIQIGESYIRMSGLDSGSSEESASDRALRGASGLFRLWRFEAERLPNPAGVSSGVSAPIVLTLEQIDRRRESRLRVANGPAQQFVAEQAAIAEIFAYIVAAERPTTTVKATEIIAQLGTQRRDAAHVFSQMLANEQAILRLWLLRAGGSASASAEGGS